MADIKQANASSVAMTITLNSLANNAARESTAVDNGTNLYLDAIVRVTVSVGTVATPKEVPIYIYGSEDGTVYEDPATGADAGITLEDPPVMRVARVIPTPTNSKAYETVFSVAACFNGSMPRKWGIVVQNTSGAALAASGNSASYTGVWQTIT